MTLRKVALRHSLWTLALLHFTQPTLAVDQCLQLTSSDACPAFQAYYVGLSGLVQRYPFLSNVTNVQSFDDALFAQAQSADDYLTTLQCSSDPSTVPYARYSLTRLCTSMIQDSDYSLPCNYDHNIAPMPLCQSTCLDWISSVSSITNNTSLCPNQQQRTQAIGSLLEPSCYTWQGFNATSNCISGNQNEPDNCGFGNDTSSACAYCKSQTDSCCDNIGRCGLSIGAIVGISIGCAAALAILGYALFVFCGRKKRVRNEKFSFKTYTRPPKNGDNDSSGFISSHSHRPLVDSTADLSDHPTIMEDIGLSDTQLSQIRTSTSENPLYEVMHDYERQKDDEMDLAKGQGVCLLYRFDDGWALGINVATREKGMIPLICIAPASEELLEQLLDANLIDRSQRESWQPSLIDTRVQ